MAKRFYFFDVTGFLSELKKMYIAKPVEVEVTHLMHAFCVPRHAHQSWDSRFPRYFFFHEIVGHLRCFTALAVQ